MCAGGIQAQQPLYDFSPPYEGYQDKHNLTPAYPVVYVRGYFNYPGDIYRRHFRHSPVQLRLRVFRSILDARLKRRNWRTFPPPPLSFGPAFVASFGVYHEHGGGIEPEFGDVSFLAN